MTLLHATLLVHGASTLAMVGVIWFVQVVHYPMFALVGEEVFRRYEGVHQRRTTLVVAPLMLVELGSAIGLLVLLGHDVRLWLSWLGLGLLGVVWLSTALVQVPLHRRLEAGFNGTLVRRLVVTNWVRTIAWSARGVVALALLEV